MLIPSLLSPLLSLWLLAPSAAAAEPTPDRPSISRSGFLAAANTLEMEVGGRWQDGARSVPSTFKVSFGSVEPRLGFNLAGLDTEQLGLNAGAKFRFGDNPKAGIAGYVATAVPTHSGEAWWATAQVLATGRFDSGRSLQGNGGLLVGAANDELALIGVPLSVLLDQPVTRHTGVFGELGCVLDQGLQNWVIDLGAHWAPTNAMVADIGAGWDLGVEAPFVQLGLTGNLGKFKR
jgi:hypothetical protein